MGGSIKKLRQSLDMVRQYVNDHDYIAECRPVDIRAALREIDEQQAEIERLRAEVDEYRLAWRKLMAATRE